jgi:SAM-dependent methyltransferase
MTGQHPGSDVDADHIKQSLLAAANRRLYPSLSDPSYLVLRSRRLIFTRWLKRFEGKNLIVLDIGGRYQPYRPLLDGRVDRYIAIDLIKTPLVTVVGNGEMLPFPPETFDMVIVTQVMDLFRDPLTAVRQIHAVLKPGGVLLASLVACAPRFVEEELWRFTRPGLSRMLAPFAQVEIVPELYSVSSVLRTINLATNVFLHYEAARAVFRRTVCPLINVLGLAMEGMRLTTNDQFTANYSVFAVKG